MKYEKKTKNQLIHEVKQLQKKLSIIVNSTTAKNMNTAEKEITKLAKFPSENPSPVLRIAKEGLLKYANSASNFLLKAWNCKIGQTVPDNWKNLITDTIESGSIKNVEVTHKHQIYSLAIVPIIEANYVNIYGQEITENKRSDKQQKLATKILELLNRSGDKSDLIRNILLEIKNSTGIEAIAIRLKENGGAPYYEAIGFTDDYEKAEESFCNCDLNDNSVDFSKENPVLKCIFSNITLSKNDSYLASHTKDGSFWTNSASELVASAAKAKQQQLRNHCIGGSYESVALIPLRSDKGIIGLIKLNDTRKNMFTLKLINFFERIGNSIGIGLINKKAEEILKRDKNIFENLVKYRTAELMNAYKKLEQVQYLSDIGTLAATVAHELRNPLATIGAAIFNIKRKNKNPALIKHIDSINKKTLDSDKIINNLLFYVRIKMPEYKRITINEISDESIAHIKKRYQKQNISIRKRCYCPNNDTINVDPIQMTELFNNLLYNAFESFPDNEGNIMIIIKYTNENFLEINIRDNGMGIDEEDIEKVIQPFFTKKSKGTGLGLAVCHRIAELHKGYMNIVSKKGIGTTVTVALPVNKNNSN